MPFLWNWFSLSSDSRFSRGIFLSLRFCLRIMIMIEPLHQSSLVQYLINLELPAKILKIKCQSRSLPWLFPFTFSIHFFLLSFLPLFFSFLFFLSVLAFFSFLLLFKIFFMSLDFPKMFKLVGKKSRFFSSVCSQMNKLINYIWAQKEDFPFSRHTLELSISSCWKCC